MTNTRGMFICFVNVVSAERLEGKLSLSIKGRNKLTSQGIQGLMSSVTKQQNGIQCHPKQARKARRCNLQSETMNHCIDSLTHPLTDRGGTAQFVDVCERLLLLYVLNSRCQPSFNILQYFCTICWQRKIWVESDCWCCYICMWQSLY